MRKRLIALSVFLVLLPSIHAARASHNDSTAAHNGSAMTGVAPVAEMHFEMAGTAHVFVKVIINGTPGWFILDTANHGMSVDTEFAKRAGLKARGGYVASGGGPEMVAAAVATDVSLGLPGINLDHERVVAIPLKPMERLLGREFDGILGSDLFDKFVVEVDYVARRIRLYDSKSFQYNRSGEILPTRLDENSFPYLNVKLAFPGREEFEAELLIDSAADFAASVEKSFAGEHGIPAPEMKTLLEKGTSVGGSYEILTGRALTLGVGRWTFKDPLIDLAQATTGGMATKDRAGLIGGDLLRRFTVTFDSNRHRIILEPNVNFDEPFEADMSGLRLRAEGDRFQTLRIRRILPDSPAAEAGLQADDIIMSVDGGPSSTLSAGGLRNMFKRPGTHRLTVLRGDVRIDVSLKLKRLI